MLFGHSIGASQEYGTLLQPHTTSPAPIHVRDNRAFKQGLWPVCTTPIPPMSFSPPAPQGQEDSLYGRLQLPPSATADDVRAAFRRLSRALHPDKHPRAASKAAANDAFARVKEAHEILSQPRLRKIYDEFGLDAARTAASPANELVPYEDLLGRFRADGAANVGGAGEGVKGAFSRDPYFSITNTLEPRFDATGLVAALEDGVFDGDGVDAMMVLTQVSLSTHATLYAAPNTTVAVQYSLMNRPRALGAGGIGGGALTRFPGAPLKQGRGTRRGGLVSAGEMALSGRRIVTDIATVDGAVFVPLDPREEVSVTAKAWRGLSELTSAGIEATCGVRERGLTLALSASRQLGTRLGAHCSWAVGNVPGVSFSIRREAYDEYVDLDARKTNEEQRKRKANDFEDVDDEGDENLGKEASSEAQDGLWKKSELLPVSALLRQMRPLAVVVSPHVWDPMGAKFSVRMGVGDATLGVSLRRPIGRNAPWLRPSEPNGPGGGHLRLRGQLGVSGWEVEAGGGRHYVTVDTFWSVSVALGTHGVMLRLKLHRSGHKFLLPIVLVSTTADARTATMAAIATSAAVSAFEILVVKPWQARAHADERAEAKKARRDAMLQAKSEAEASRELMRRVVQGSIEREGAVDGGGLIVVRAIYGLRKVVADVRMDAPSYDGREIEEEAVEVGDCVQMLVEESRVQMISATKSNILGFWDPTALGDEDKALRVWYRFKGAMHDGIVDDWEPLELPLSMHRL